MTDLTYEERKRLRRAAEDARDACNRHYGPFVDVVAHPLNILALLDMAARAAQPQPSGQAQPEAEPASCIEEDGCPKELAVLQRFWRESQRTKPVTATLRCRRCGESANVDISSAHVVTRWPDGTPRDPRDIASDPSGKLIHDPAGPLRAAQPQPSGDAGELPQVVLPPKPTPIYEVDGYSPHGRVSYDCYDRAEILVYGRACAEAQRIADSAALAAMEKQK